MQFEFVTFQIGKEEDMQRETRTERKRQKTEIAPAVLFAVESLERRLLLSYSISPNPASVNENGGTLTFTVNRSNSSLAATVYASTVQDQGYSNASGYYNGVLNQAVGFSAGQSSAQVSVTINDKGLTSGSEAFRFIVQQFTSDPVGTYLATDNFTINNNDVIPVTYSISPNPASVNENGGSLTFTVTRSNSSSAATVYASTVQDQGPLNNGYYVGLNSQSVSFSSGQSTAQVSVTINDKGLTSGSETFRFIVQQNASDPVATYLATDNFTIVNTDPGTGSTGPIYGLDARNTGIAAYAQQLKADGKSFIGQYIGGDSTYLTPSQATAIQAAGLQLFSIYEKSGMADTDSNGNHTYAWQGYFSEAQGEADAQSAYRAATLFAQQPFGSAIYFGIDVNPASTSGITEADALNEIDQYFRGLQTYFSSLPAGSSYTVGVYGAGDTLTKVMNDSAATYSWLASPHGWAGFSTWYPSGASSYAWNIHQIQNFNTSSYGGIPIDTDETSGLPFGAWNAGTVANTYSISPNPASVNENGGSLTFTVTRSNSSSAATVYASTVPDQGTTNANGYYVGLSSQAVSFSAGQSTAQVSVTINDKGLTSGSETFRFIVQQNASDPVATYLATDNFTIVNNDVQPSRVAVQVASNIVISGQSTAIDFGNVTQGQSGPSLTFSVQNTGGSPLILGAASAPTGYTVTANLSSPLAPGGTETFTVRLDSVTLGTKPGSISFATSDPSIPTFSFPVTGVVNAVATYNIAGSASPAVAGTITGTGTYATGANVVVTAAANAGYQFVNWTESGTVVNSTTAYAFTVTANRTLVANFNVIPANYTLTVTSTVGGSVTKSPDQVNYSSGTQVTLTATPNAGFQFASWSGDATGNTNPLLLTMDGNKSITANFTTIPSSAAVLVASSLNHPEQLLLDAGNLYFVDNSATDGILKRVAGGGGGVSTLVTGAWNTQNGGAAPGIRNYQLNGATIFLGDGSGDNGAYYSTLIYSAPKNGGALTNIGNSTGHFVGVIGNDVYFTYILNGITNLYHNGALVANNLPLTSSVVDGSTIYSVVSGTNNVVKVDTTTNAVTTLIQGNASLGDIFIDSQNVYLNIGGSIKVVSKNGGAVNTLVTSTTAKGYASDGQSVYFVDGGYIRQVAVSGGTPTNVVSVTGQTVSSLVTDGTTLYWSDTSAGAGTGKIYAFVKSLAVTGTNGAILVKKDATDSTKADVTINGAMTQVSIAQAAIFMIAGGAANDVLTVDFSNGNPLPNGGITFDGGGGTNTVAIIGTPANDTLTVTAAGLTFTGGIFGTVPITTASVQSIQFPGGSGGNDSLHLTAGTYTVDADTLTGTANVSVTVDPAATANFATDQHLANLTLNGGVANLSTTRHSMYVNGLTINNNGLLDIANSFLYLNRTVTSLATAKSYLDAAYNLHGLSNTNAPTAGDYKGLGGITSSLAKTSYATDQVIGIGYYDGALQDPNNPDSIGQLLGPNSNSGHGTGIPLNQILIRPTLTGDLNGDGVVNSYDVSLFNTFGLFNTGPTVLGWQGGDLNGDGVVDTRDVTIFNTVGNFNVGAFPAVAPLSATVTARLLAALPSVVKSSIAIPTTTVSSATRKPHVAQRVLRHLVHHLNPLARRVHKSLKIPRR